MKLRKPAAFNRSVWFYDGLAQLIFGGAIRKSQIQLLSFIPPQASILLIGGGTGWILRDMAQLGLPLKITYLEASAGMLAKARQVADQLSTEFLKIDFRQGTETSLKPGENFDIIFIPFVLDLYSEEQVRQMIHHLHVYLKPNGLWLVADFFISPELKGWSRWWRTGITKMMYTFFSWLEGLTTTNLPHLPLQFQSLSVALLHQQSFFQGFIQTQVYQKRFAKPN